MAGGMGDVGVDVIIVFENGIEVLLIIALVGAGYAFKTLMKTDPTQILWTSRPHNFSG